VNIPITTFTLPTLTLKSRQSKVEHLKFTYPSAITNGNYYLVAVITPTTTKAPPAVAVNSLGVAIGPPSVDLAASFEIDPVRVTAGKTTSALLTIENKGNVVATGTVGVNLYSSEDLTLDANDPLLAQLSDVKVRIRPGKSKRLRIRFLAPQNMTGGTYNLIASMTPSTQPVDGNVQNNVAMVATQP
jgi:uncharacterized membrane protein